MIEAVLSMGSNAGARLPKLRAAVRRLRSLPRSRLGPVSSLYETSPVEAPGPAYLNAAARLRTSLSPMGLLVELKRIEAALGRRPSPRNAPRPADLDIVFYGRLRKSTRWLTLPHARARNRLFVLRPLAELGVRLAPARLAGAQAVRRIKKRGWAAAAALALCASAAPARAVTPWQDAGWAAASAAVLAAAPVAAWFWGGPEQVTFADQWAYPFRLQSRFERLDARYDMLVGRLSWRLPPTRHFYWVVEPTLGYFYEPKGAGFGGSGLLLNWQPLSAGRVRPYLEAGAGTLAADSTPLLDGPLDFELLVGGGLNLALSDHWALFLGYRGHHISNGALYRPNIGVNAHMPVVGVSWLR